MTLAKTKKTNRSRAWAAALAFVAAALVLAAFAAVTTHMSAIKAAQAPVSAQVALD